MIQESMASGLRLKIEFAQLSDPGRDPNKQVNEDSCGYAETRFGHLCVLCDGMGGHYGGKEASRTAITTIFEVFDQAPQTLAPMQVLKNAIEEAGRRVYRLGGAPDNRTRPGSTVVALLLHDRGLDVAHVGDSRAYVVRSNQIYPLTRDHSMVQGMIDAGMLTEESAMGHPDSNKITRALGMRPEVEVEVRPETMELFAGDVLLQSSDGLTDLALGREILGATRQALSSGPVSHACTMLVQMANERGGHDNITVQMVRVVEVGSKGVTTIPDAPQRSLPGGPPVHTGDPTLPSAGTPPWSPVFNPPAGVTTVGDPPVVTPPPTSETRPMLAPPPGGMQWAPIGPTTHGGGAGATAGQPPPSAPPTLNEPIGIQPWTSALYAGSGVRGGPQGPQLQGPHGPPGMPLPSPSGRSYDAPPAASPFAAGPLATPPVTGLSAYGGPPSGGPASSPRASHGGLVFMIIGLSSMIAALILVAVWWFILRAS